MQIQYTEIPVEGYVSSDSIQASQIQYPEYSADGYATPYDYPDYPQQLQDETIAQQFQNEVRIMRILNEK